MGSGESVAPCVGCRGRPGIGDGVVRLGEYTGELRRRILDLKYGGRADVAESLGAELAAVIADESVLDPASTIVTAVPGALWRVWHRGIDHASEISREVARNLYLPPVDALSHLGTPPRSGGGRGRRRGRSLRVRSAWRSGSLEGLEVILVDDVLTSGATLREACHLLRPLRPRRILAGVLAVSVDSRRIAGPSRKIAPKTSPRSLDR